MNNNKYDFIAVFDNHTDFSAPVIKHYNNITYTDAFITAYEYSKAGIVTAPGAFSLYIDPDSLNLEL